MRNAVLCAVVARDVCSYRHDTLASTAYLAHGHVVVAVLISCDIVVAELRGHVLGPHVHVALIGRYDVYAATIIGRVKIVEAEHEVHFAVERVHFALHRKVARDGVGGKIEIVGAVVALLRVEHSRLIDLLYSVAVGTQDKRHEFDIHSLVAPYLGCSRLRINIFEVEERGDGVSLLAFEGLSYVALGTAVVAGSSHDDASRSEHLVRQHVEG